MRWLHSKSHGRYSALNFWLTMPSIVVSALAGYATIGLTDVYTEASSQRLVNVGIGLMTLSTTVLTAVNQYMKSSQLSEAHRAAAVQYGKLYRTVTTELALRRDQRVHATDFIKAVRLEQDRLDESRPEVPPGVLQKFRKEFGTRTDIQKPEIAGDIDRVIINHSLKRQDGQIESLQVPKSPIFRGGPTTVVPLDGGPQSKV
jgi:hypothetical protein